LLTHLRTFFYGAPGAFVDRVPVLMIIGSIWINDTMAYIVGSLIGRTPLSAISPKKTWEGTVGGIILAIGVMGGIGFLLNRNVSWNVFAPCHWMIVGAIAAIAGTFGDLLESKLKRMAGIKDSGRIMPGHGGFLDRFDSLLVATPFCWLYLMWVI
jgi:phosphatidate cytidylyltransferase